MSSSCFRFCFDRTVWSNRPALRLLDQPNEKGFLVFFVLFIFFLSLLFLNHQMHKIQPCWVAAILFTRRTHFGRLQISLCSFFTNDRWFLQPFKQQLLYQIHICWCSRNSGSISCSLAIWWDVKWKSRFKWEIRASGRNQLSLTENCPEMMSQYHISSCCQINNICKNPRSVHFQCMGHLSKECTHF